MQLRTLKDVTTLIEQLESSWNQETDPDALLEQLHASYTVSDDDSGSNLLNFIAYQSDTKFENVLKRCLDLIEKIAHHRKTDLVRLLSLFTTASTITKRNACGWMSKYYQEQGRHHEQIEKYCQIIHLIAQRHDHNDASLNELRKLIIHHDQRGQERGKEFDGSIVFDLVTLAKTTGSQLALENYLATLVHLAETKKIDSDSIYNALRTPLGITENIGTKIAYISSSLRPESFLHFTRLCDFLAPSQIDQLFPSDYAPFVYNFEYDVCEYIEKLPTPEEQIAMCERARNKDSALGRFMLLKCDNHECSDEWGANSKLKSIYGKALVSREEQKKNSTKTAAMPPKPSAPLLEESEYMQLFANANKSEYEKYIRRASQKFEFKHADEATKALRYAAAYGHNEDLVNLLEEHKVDVNAHNDVCDKCADATALYLAVEQNNVEGVRILLEHQAKPNIERRHGVTPFCFAAINGNVDIARLLLKHGAQVNIVSRHRNSPLYFAARMGHPELISLIIDHYQQTYGNDIQSLVDFLRKDSQLLRSIEDAADGETLLALAKLVDLLIEKGVDKNLLNTMIPSNNTFKNKKLKESLVEAIEKLPQKERFNVCSKIMCEPQHLLHKLVRIKRGGLFSKQPRRGAGILGKIELIRNNSIKDRPAIIDEYKNDDLRAQHLQRYDAALQADSNHDIVNYAYGIFLHQAVARNDIKMIELLLKYGANPALRRPTHIDIIKSTVSITKADPTRLNAYLARLEDQQDVANILPEELAELCHHDEIAALLRKHREELEQRVTVSTPVTIPEATQQVTRSFLFETPVERIYPDLTIISATEKNEPAPVVLLNPITGEPLPQASTALSSDPFAAIDAILKAPVPAKACVNPFTEWVEREKQAVAKKPGYKNPFDDLTDEQHDAQVAAQLDALPAARKGFGLFAASNQQEEKKQPAAQKKQAVML